MTINLYLASFDTCHEWPGRWFEISSLEDLRDAVSVCNSYGVEEIYEAIEPRVVRDYFL